MMSFIRIITTKTLTLKQEKEVTLSLQNILKNYHNEANFMIQIEDNQVMYLNAQEIECIRLEIFIRENYSQCLKKEIMNTIKMITDIPTSHQSIELFVMS